MTDVQPQVVVGSHIAFIVPTQGGGRMFAYEVKVTGVDIAVANCEGPSQKLVVPLDKITWNGKRFETLIGTEPMPHPAFDGPRAKTKRKGPRAVRT